MSDSIPLKSDCDCCITMGRWFTIAQQLGVGSKWICPECGGIIPAVFEAEVDE